MQAIFKPDFTGAVLYASNGKRWPCRFYGETVDGERIYTVNGTYWNVIVQPDRETAALTGAQGHSAPRWHIELRGWH